MFILVLYQESIPYESPPSYRGQCVKYNYKITIGTQRVNSPIKLLRVPVRILVLCGKSLDVDFTPYKNYR